MATLAPGGAAAQRSDSTRVGPTARPTVGDSARRAVRRAIRGDTSNRPPITPRKAFLRSLLLPGWGQASLSRGAAGGVFGLIEGLSATMIAKSAADLAEARRAQHDSLFLGYDTVSATVDGQTVFVPKLDSLGNPIPRYGANELAGRIHARKQHVEDWVALLLANHLFSAADAFVAAHLWDIPKASVAVRPRRDGAVVSARIVW